jgi:hypothetical protein
LSFRQQICFNQTINEGEYQEEQTKERTQKHRGSREIRMKEEKNRGTKKKRTQGTNNTRVLSQGQTRTQEEDQTNADRGRLLADQVSHFSSLPVLHFV